MIGTTGIVNSSNGTSGISCKLNESNIDDKDSSLEMNHLNPYMHRKSDVKSTWNDLIWENIIYIGYLHLGAVYGLYLLFTGQCKISTILMTLLFMHWGILGIIAGSHRLWSHRGYKATWQLKLILTFFNTIANHCSIWYWVISHRVHHKCSDTDGDPHNSGRGLFFSHIGWCMVKEHPLVTENRATIDMSDANNDPFVMFQKKHYLWLAPLISIILPTFILFNYFGESLTVAWHFAYCFRHCFILNAIFLVNSFAHAAGTKPYDKSIRPSQNLFLSYLTHGEGWHNYHHVFPWDYKSAELGNFRYNFTTAFIDFFAKIGWAYDLKTASDEFIKKRMARTGDYNLEYTNAEPDDLKKYTNKKAEAPEGWNDSDNELMMKGFTILHKTSSG